MNGFSFVRFLLMMFSISCVEFSTINCATKLISPLLNVPYLYMEYDF